MNSHRGTIRALSLALAAATTVAVDGLAASAAPAASGIALTRWQGPDRYGTAAALAKAAYPGGAANAVVASGESFPDALSASYLAGYLHAPILLTEAHDLPGETAAALRQLGVTHVYLVGGAAAADASVQAQLGAVPGVTQVTRESGPSRYDTSQAIATTPPASAVGRINGQPTALIASGASFPDALAGSAVAAGAGLPILLTEPDTLSPQAASALKQLGVTQVLVLGGPAAVSPGVEDALRRLGVSVQRLSGPDRGATAAAIATYAVGTAGFDPARVAFARGDNAGGGVDALALGALAGVHHEPLLLTDSPTQAGAATLGWVTAAGGRLSAGDVAGGPGAISDQLLAQLGTPASGNPGGGNPLVGQYSVTLTGAADGNPIQRTGTLVVRGPVITVAGDNHPLDICLHSGTPAAVPDAGAIWYSSNSACNPGATPAAIDMGPVTVDGSTIAFQPDANVSAAAGNVFTAYNNPIFSCPYFPVSGGESVTINGDGTLSGTIDIIGYGEGCAGNVEYKAQISGQRQ
jgi:putative cell wall-binding protein